jgi:molybdopterin-guanine dinucleotide biosynthesis protein A
MTNLKWKTYNSVSICPHTRRPIFPVQLKLVGEHHHPSGFPALEPIFDLEEYGDIGPAAGLLAAHAAHPAATLLVLGCDYSLLPPAALQQLILEYEPPLTCFVNTEGFTEPLIAVWSPEALEALVEEVREGRSGLNRVLGMLSGKKVSPLRDTWITRCNTREEWEEALRLLQQKASCVK